MIDPFYLDIVMCANRAGPCQPFYNYSLRLKPTNQKEHTPSYHKTRKKSTGIRIDARGNGQFTYHVRFSDKLSGRRMRFMAGPCSPCIPINYSFLHLLFIKYCVISFEYLLLLPCSGYSRGEVFEVRSNRGSLH